MYSIYHFFKTLFERHEQFQSVAKLENFPFDNRLLSCSNAGQFPDLAIKINSKQTELTGGELIELKDSETYSVSSFNSTIPTGQKEIAKLLKGENSTMRQQMTTSGDNPETLPTREVFYLVRGKKKGQQKICLVHGSFFETVKSPELISGAFSQVLEERLAEEGQTLSDEMKTVLVNLFSEQANFSRVRNMDKASVKLRFRIMTEVKAEGNILNEKKYPEIGDDSLNLVLPLHDLKNEPILRGYFGSILGENAAKFSIFKMKHHFNGYFLVFQISLKKN